MNVFFVSDRAAGTETGPYEEPVERVAWMWFVGGEVFGTMHGDGVIIFWLYPHHRYGKVVHVGQIRQNLYTTEYSSLLGVFRRCYFNVVTNRNSARNFSWRERSPWLQTYLVPALQPTACDIGDLLKAPSISCFLQWWAFMDLLGQSEVMLLKPL